MTLDRDAVKATIRDKVIALARALGMDASAIGDDEIIPATGLLDSSAVLELVVWYEQTDRRDGGLPAGAQGGRWCLRAGTPPTAPINHEC